MRRALGAARTAGLGWWPPGGGGYFSVMKSGPPPGRRTVYAFAKGPATPTGERKLWHNLCHQPLSHGYAVPAPLTQGSLGGGATPIGEIKLNHDLHRQSLRHGCAVPPPFTQGRLSPLGDRHLGLKSLLPAFHHRKVTPAGQACQPSPSGDSATPKAR